MSVYYFQESKVDLPEMLIDESRLFISLTGSSYPEDISECYHEFLSEMKKIVPEPNSVITCEFKFIILGSASIRILHEIFLYLDNLKSKNIKTIINWYYDEEDEDMKEIGTSFSELLDMDFNLLVLK